MASEIFQVYRHSGKFGVQGPVLALAGAAVASFPLGLAYSYLIKWIPFIYLNFLLTAGYGFVIGLLTGLVLKFGKVRNTPLTALCGLLTGVIALYFAWSAHVNAVFEGAPVFCLPTEILTAIKYLFGEGTWGMRSGGNVTGIPLAIVWVVEGSIIIGLCTFVSFGMISDTPFCEKNQCWLDEEKKIDTLAAFTDPVQLAALKAGNLGPLSQATARAPASAAFGRLTLKRSPRCNIFCTVRVENVALNTDKDGKTSEKAEKLTGNLVLPQSMFELIARFEKFKPAGSDVAQ